nr:hypothetical protein [uncultured Mediterranean phage uvMED]
MADQEKDPEFYEVRTAPFGPPQSIGNYEWNKGRWPWGPPRVSSYSNRDPRKFYWLDDPKYVPKPDDDIGDIILDPEGEGIMSFFYGWEDEWQSGPSEGGAVEDHGMDGQGYWSSQNMGPKNHWFPEKYSSDHYVTGLQFTQKRGGMPDESLSEIDHCFLYNVGHSTIGRSAQDPNDKPDARGPAATEYETCNEMGVVGYSGFYYPEKDNGANTDFKNRNVHASIDIKHAYVMYQSHLARRIQPGDINWGCQLFPKWPSCKKDGKFNVNDMFQKDGSKAIPTEFGTLVKPKDGDWKWDWPDDLDLTVKVGDNKWRKKMASMVYGVLSSRMLEWNYEGHFNRRMASGKITWLEVLMPVWAPYFEQYVQRNIAAVAKASRPVSGERLINDAFMGGNCAEKYRTSKYKPGAWRKSRLLEAASSTDSKIKSWDVAWADWKAYYEHKREHPSHHRRNKYGECIEKFSCNSFPPNFRGHPIDERRPGEDVARCFEFIFWFGKDLGNEAVKKLHDTYFPHHLNPDGTTNEFCDCYKVGTPKWSDKTFPNMGGPNEKFKNYTNLPKKWNRKPLRNFGINGGYPLNWDPIENAVGIGIIDPNAPTPPPLDTDADGNQGDESIEDWLNHLLNYPINRDEGERLQDLPDLNDFQRRWAERLDNIYDRRQARDEEIRRRQEEIRQRLEDELIDMLPDVPDHEPGGDGDFPWDEDWTLQDWFDQLGDRDPDADPIIDIDWENLFPNIDLDDLWNPGEGGFDWASFWEQFWDQFWDFDWGNPDVERPDWFPSLSDLFPNLDLGDSGNLLDFIEIIQNIDLKKVIKKIIKKIFGDLLPPFVPGIIAEIISLILWILQLGDSLDDAATSLETLKSIDFIAEMKPAGANNRPWGDPKRKDYLWSDYRPHGFFSGVIAPEIREVIHFFEFEANGMLLHMNGNSDTGHLTDGVQRVKIMRLMDFAPIFSPGYGRLTMSSARKVLNHYGFSDPPQGRADEYLALDTRDDHNYKLSQENVWAHRKDAEDDNGVPTKTERRFMARIVNDNGLTLSDIRDIIQDGELPEFEEPDATVQEKAPVFVPTDWPGPSHEPAAGSTSVDE